VRRGQRQGEQSGPGAGGYAELGRILATILVIFPLLLLLASAWWK